MKVTREADIIFACGAPGSGKSHYIKDELARRKPERLIIVDPDGEYEGFGYLNDTPADAMRATGFPAFRTRFRPSFDRATAERQFDVLCQLVRWHADPQPGQKPPPKAGPLTFVVDELAEFIGPSFRDAPLSFQWIVKRGRKYGVSLLAASQRPAEISKTLFDLASTVRTGRLNNPASQKAAADACDVQVDDVRALVDHQFIQRDKVTGSLITPQKTLRPYVRPAVKRSKPR